MPVIIRAFHVNFDQKTLGLRISYKPPRTQIPAKNPKLTCANVNRVSPGQCRVVGPNAWRSTPCAPSCCSRERGDHEG